MDKEFYIITGSNYDDSTSLTQSNSSFQNNLAVILDNRTSMYEMALLKLNISQKMKHPVPILGNANCWDFVVLNYDVILEAKKFKLTQSIPVETIPGAVLGTIRIDNLSEISAKFEPFLIDVENKIGTSFNFINMNAHRSYVLGVNKQYVQKKFVSFPNPNSLMKFTYKGSMYFGSELSAESRSTSYTIHFKTWGEYTPEIIQVECMEKGLLC